ncbi:nose resistant to fluoxetine protein 6 [Rhipicephalus sanguineus]|uniref:nose resistant to fluoxetine protein 6 n=1 Tax=Rhipicephalus sanguineus TaxID=34632 RepID=UPI0020C42D1F|nr:nose resistant to fluoxetine protein 6 [Rhipicephalus sanguineus]
MPDGSESENVADIDRTFSEYFTNLFSEGDPDTGADVSIRELEPELTLHRVAEKLALATYDALRASHELRFKPSPCVQTVLPRTVYFGTRASLRKPNDVARASRDLWNLDRVCVIARAASASQGLSSTEDEGGKRGGPSEGATSSLLRGLVASVVPVLQRSFARANVSALCTEALMDFSRRILRMDIAAWRFLDATGKFPSGILEGTTGDLGAYDECLASRLEPASEVKSSLSSRGQYCSVFLKPKQSRAMDKLISQLTRYPVIKKRFNLTMARKAIRKGRVRGLRFGLVIYSALAFCVLLGTILDVLERLKKNEPSLLRKDKKAGVWTVAWKAFSAAKNTESLLKETPPEHESLKCLNGLRFFTALWVILGHSYNILDPHILGRGLGIFEMTNEFFFCIIANAYPSVESFFVLSGFLLVYQMYPKLKDVRSRIMVFLTAEIRRYIRLTVPTALLLGSVFLLPLVVRGPAADQWLPGKVVNCYQSWPAVILHYNNWLTHVRICSGHLWYIACDMQIFTLVSVLCILLSINARLGIAAMVSVSIGCNAFIAYFTHKAQIGPSRVSSGGDVSKMMQALDLIHQRPYPHVGSYVAGALAGFAFLRFRNVRIGRVAQLAMWSFSTAACVYGVFGAFKWLKGAPPTGADVVLYNGLHRTLFAAGIAWVLYACASGHAGLVNRFLAWDAFVPLGRLTFSVYLVHFFVLVATPGMARERIYIAHWFLVRGFLGNAVLSYLFGWAFYLVCEKPFSNIERSCFDRFVNRRGREQSRTNDSCASSMVVLTANQRNELLDEASSASKLQGAAVLASGVVATDYGGCCRNTR